MIPKNPPMQAGFSAFLFLSTEAFRYYSLLTRCQLSANLPDEVDHEAGDGKKEGGTKSDVEHRSGRAGGDSGSGSESSGADAIDGFEGGISHFLGGGLGSSEARKSLDTSNPISHYFLCQIISKIAPIQRINPKSLGRQDQKRLYIFRRIRNSFCYHCPNANPYHWIQKPS